MCVLDESLCTGRGDDRGLRFQTVSVGQHPGKMPTAHSKRATQAAFTSATAPRDPCGVKEPGGFGSVLGSWQQGLICPASCVEGTWHRGRGSTPPCREQVWGHSSVTLFCSEFLWARTVAQSNLRKRGQKGPWGRARGLQGTEVCSAQSTPRVARMREL